MAEQAILTALCMIYDGDKLLLQDRIKEDWRGLTFPGGHVEKGEPSVTAIIREIKEETGLTIEHPRLCGLKQFQTEDDERYVVMLFKTDRFSGQLRSSEEGEMVWVDRRELQNRPLAHGFFDTLRVCDEAGITELCYEYDKEKNDWMPIFY